MKKHAGLSLIEVLIAGLLLSMALGIAAVAFQQNDLQQAQAERLLQRASQLDSVINYIRHEIQQGQQQGQWQWSDDSYVWQAKALATADVMSGYDADAATMVSAGQQKTLYQIKVSLAGKPLYQFQLML